MFIMEAMLTALRTIMPTRSCGVETTTTPSSGMLWKTVSGTSPVPGGMSMTMTSSSPQETSSQNCLTAPAMTGPRQMTGESSRSSSRLMLMTRTPFSVSAGKMCSPSPMAFSRMPNILGMDGPVMSASSTPTR